ncbi:MAG TPA: hypothetical protein RMH99_01880 [Sandaracinaceae bacterium LLY-WYZ-13_1]|nr:hypothetical protein [Sandaracinaceae bacterium LLY-WYZ-13_1]
MMRSRLVVAALLTCLASCDDPSLRLVVELKTDWVPGVEVEAVTTTLRTDDPAAREVATTRANVATSDLLAGARIAELEDLEPGRYALEARLERPNGETLEIRRILVELRSSAVVTVLATRDCAGIACPGPSDPASATECVDMRCVEPSCTPETPASCPPPTCTRDDDCPAPPASCAVSRCVDGACLDSAREDACGAGTYCDPQAGCLARPGVDAGPPDAGARDGGIPPRDGGIDPSMITWTCNPTGDGVPLAYEVVEPTPVSLPPPGGSYMDGATGVEVYRVTGPSDGTGARLSPHPRGGVRGSNVLVVVDGALQLRDVGEITSGTVAVEPVSDGLGCRPDSTGFGRLSFELFCVEDDTARVWRIDTQMPRPAGQTLERDLSSELPPGATIEQLVWDGDETLFAALVRDDDGALTSVVAYDGLGTVYHRDYPPDRLRGLLMTGRGVQVIVQLENHWELWDPRSGDVSVVWYGPGERASLCAHDHAYETLVGFDCYEPGFLFRTMDYPVVWASFGPLRHTDGTPADDMAATVAMHDSQFAAVATHTLTGAGLSTWDPWEQEVLVLSVDGSTMRRLAHHHSDLVAGGPEAAPRISSDTSWVAFDSYFDGGRYDVFLVASVDPCEL